MEEFTKELIRRLEENLGLTGDKYLIDKHTVCKNNDTVQTSLSIRKGNEQIARNFYIEPLFAMNKGGADIDSIVEKILTDNSSKEYVGCIEENLNAYGDYECVKEKLIVKVVCEELNKTFLKDKAYIRIANTNLVAVFYIFISRTDSGLISTSVTKSMLQKWNVQSLDELYSVALDNTMKLLPSTIKNIVTFIGEYLMDSFEDEITEKTGKTMYILSNDIGVNGATSVLYNNVLREFANNHNVDKVLILSSSIHEVLLLPQYQDLDYYSASETVKEINECVVSDADVLSNNIYIYDVKTDSISIKFDD